VSKLTKVGTFTLTTEEEIQHFLEWRELYEPAGQQKLFACETEIYQEDGGAFFRTLVTFFVKERKVSGEEM